MTARNKENTSNYQLSHQVLQPHQTKSRILHNPQLKFSLKFITREKERERIVLHGDFGAVRSRPRS
jgi:hypothetical protein